MAKFGWRRDLFDIKWLTNGLRVSAEGPPAGQRLTLLLPATLSQGSKWWIDELVLKKKLKPDVDLQYATSYLEEA